MTTTSIILFACHEEALLAPQALETFLATCQAAGARAEVLGDLPALAEQYDPRLLPLADKTPAPIFVSPYTPRAVRALLNYAGVSAAALDALTFVRLAGDDPASAILNTLGSEPPSPTPADRKAARDLLAKTHTAETEDSWRPWFPVIDYDACVHCKQCAGFCLFGVYEVDSQDHVTVINPRRCKNNCPACARVCPKQAILFPKHPKGPVAGEDAPDQAAQADEPMDLKAFVDGDVLEALRQRQQTGDTQHTDLMEKLAKPAESQDAAAPSPSLIPIPLKKPSPESMEDDS